MQMEITQNALDIATNLASIATNSGLIQDNADDIDANRLLIDDNADDIVDIQTDITNLQTEDTNLQAQITSNDADILNVENIAISNQNLASHNNNLINNNIADIAALNATIVSLQPVPGCVNSFQNIVFDITTVDEGVFWCTDYFMPTGTHLAGNAVYAVAWQSMHTVFPPGFLPKPGQTVPSIRVGMSVTPNQHVLSFTGGTNSLIGNQSNYIFRVAGDYSAYYTEADSGRYVGSTSWNLSNWEAEDELKIYYPDYIVDNKTIGMSFYVAINNVQIQDVNGTWQRANSASTFPIPLEFKIKFFIY